MNYIKDFALGGFRLSALGQSVFLSLCSEIRDGYLEITLPDRSVRCFGDKSAAEKAHLTVLNSGFFSKLVARADVGFAEAYMDGDIQTPNLTAVLVTLVKNRQYMGNLDTSFAWFGHLADKLSHWRAANTTGQAQDNVAAHYDLSNEMFQCFLDETMTYSCAFFTSEKETLQEAQLNKIRKMINKAKLRPEHHLLEIGSGWGALAMEAVRMTGCRVTSLTLSVEQKELADQRIAEAGLSDRIEILVCDYRKLEGQFDRIISVEMIEQVGHEFLGEYFACCQRLLKQDGIMVLQAITVPDFRYDDYIRGCDFIQKYIFPGGVCPCVSSMVAAMAQHTQLVLDNLENIGPHYARTLRMWSENFQASAKTIAQLGFDERFQRMWEYYFAYCEAGFATRTLGTVQMVLSRTGVMDLSDGVPR